MSELYLYGITRPRPLPGRLAELGIELVVAGDRAAIVSAIDASPVEPTRRNVLAHADVVESLHETGVVLPARFGTVFPDREGLVDLLSLAEIGALLDRLAGSCELRVKASYDESVLAELAPAVLGLRDEYRRAPTFEHGLALGEAVAEALSGRRSRDADRIVATVRPFASTMFVGDPVGEFAAVDLSLLVERGRVEEVARALDGLGREVTPPLRIALVGPLPPYSFVDLRPGVPA